MSDFVDTNIFVRFLAQDDADRSVRAQELLERAQRGEIQLATSEAMVLETVQVLSSPRLYQMPRPILSTVMQSLLENRGLRLDHKETIIRAFDIYRGTRLDFADCLAIEHARRLDAAICSFDHGLDRVPGVRRIEP